MNKRNTNTYDAYKKEEEINKVIKTVKNTQNYPYGWIIEIIDIIESTIHSFFGSTCRIIKIENQKNPDGSTNYKAILNAFLNAAITLVLFYIYLKLTKQL